ncbi:MAG: ketoacyl-ACP synthase III [Lentisphaeria bacterium]|nr:ketoacyl-ACP synthase III [Lentisphaeria bacterium]
MSIKLKGTGCFVPERVLSNQDLEKIVDTTDEWITTRTGIKNRHIAPEEMPTSDMALGAARNALENAGLQPDDLDFIIVATSSGDYPFPSTACVLQGKLGMKKKCQCFDISAACSGLLYSIDTGTNLLRGHKNYRYGLMIGAEKLSYLADWKDRATCVLFGDAASAVILEKVDDSANDDFLLASSLGADGTCVDLLLHPVGGSANPATAENVDTHDNALNMNGPEVFKHAVPAMVAAAKVALTEAGVAAEQLRWVIPHQANKRIIDAVASRLGVTEEHVFVNIQDYGNTSAASIGICLDELNRSGRLERGDLVLATSFGAGLTWASALIRW